VGEAAASASVRVVPPLPAGEIPVVCRLQVTLGVLTPFGEVSLVLVHVVPTLPASEVSTSGADLFIILPPRVVGMDVLAFPPTFLVVPAASCIHHATSWPTAVPDLPDS